MASYTTNLNLKKPAGSENVAIGDINNNMDAIDTAYGEMDNKIKQFVGSTNGVSDCDTVTTAGLYRIISSTTNSPFSYGVLLHLDANGYKAQIAISTGSNADLAFRKYTSNAWGQWYKVTATAV